MENVKGIFEGTNGSGIRKSDLAVWQFTFLNKVGIDLLRNKMEGRWRHHRP
jgi:hypothetical protein